MGSIRACCWILLQRRGHFAWHWASQCTDTSAFYIAALSIIFLLLGFRQWRSRTDRISTLNMNIRRHPTSTVLEQLESCPGPDSATCAGLADGHDYSHCRALELKLQKCQAIGFPWIVENTFKQWPTVRVTHWTVPTVTHRTDPTRQPLVMPAVAWSLGPACQHALARPNEPWRFAGSGRSRTPASTITRRPPPPIQTTWQPDRMSCGGPPSTDLLRFCFR